MVNAVKVYKKTSPNGKLTVYLGRRDFVDNTTTTEPIDGVLIVTDDYLRGRRVFAAVNVVYRFGREEDEVMGVSFTRDLTLVNEQIYPSKTSVDPTHVQDRLIRKVGGNAYPFQVNLPDNAPMSVQLHAAEDESSKPLGVIYELMVYAGDSPEDRPHKRNSVCLAVRKIQFAPTVTSKRQPSTLASKGFALSSGKLNMEVTLDKELYYHGETIKANLSIKNGSKKSVKNIKCSVCQHIELTMTNNMFTKEVSVLESKEGCPITPGSNLQKSVSMTPLASSNKAKFGLALDGKLKDSDANLASSTLLGQGKTANDANGIVVTYSCRVKLNCGAIGGELVADLPFKLVNPAPNAASGDDVDIEDFARMRRGQSIDMN